MNFTDILLVHRADSSVSKVAADQEQGHVNDSWNPHEKLGMRTFIDPELEEGGRRLPGVPWSLSLALLVTFGHGETLPQKSR